MKNIVLAFLVALCLHVSANSDIPKTITVRPHTFDTSDGVRRLVQGHPGWSLTSQRRGRIILHGWYHDNNLVQVEVFNGGIVPHDRILELDAGPFQLSSQSGYGFVDEEWLDSLAVVDSNPYDPWYDRASFPKITKETGSSNMRFYSPDELIAQRYGVSKSVVRFYHRYHQHQLKRPRWFLDATGMPAGLQYPHWKNRLFGEWNENSQGMNAYDLQHYDAYELYSGYKFTRNPSYLFSMINLWTHAETHGWYVRHVNDQTYGGSQRTLGWYLVASCQLYQMLAYHGDLYSDLMARVKETIEWHVTNGIDQFPISSPYWSGSPPSEFRTLKKNYIFGWQYAVVSHGMLWVRDTFKDVDPELSDIAHDHAMQIVQYITDHSDEASHSNGAGWIGYAWSPDDDPALHFKGRPPGVAQWYLPSLMRFTNTEFPLRESMLRWHTENGWHQESHRYFTYALSYIGAPIWDLR